MLLLTNGRVAARWAPWLSVLLRDHTHCAVLEHLACSHMPIVKCSQAVLCCLHCSACSKL